jgi:hypothetical protein
MANSILSSLTDLFSAFASEEEKKQESSKKQGGASVPPMMSPPNIPQGGDEYGGIETNVVKNPTDYSMVSKPAGAVEQFLINQNVIRPTSPSTKAIDKQNRIDAIQGAVDSTGNFVSGLIPNSAEDAGYKIGTAIDKGIAAVPPMLNSGVDYVSNKIIQPMGDNIQDAVDVVRYDPSIQQGVSWVKENAPKVVPSVSVDLDRLDPRNKNRAERLQSIPQGGDEYGGIDIESRAIVDGKPGPVVGNVADAPLDFSQATPPPVEGVPEKPVTSLQQTSQVLGQGTQAIEDNDVTNKLPKPNKDDVDDNGQIKEDSPWYKTVFSNIGSYLGDAFSSTMNDPVVKRALVSYLASRAVGTSASGAATFAGEVLQNGWEQQADLDLATGKAASAAAAATAKDRVIDRTKIHTLFNSGDNSQLNGYYSKDSTIFEPSDPIAFAKAYGIEPNENGLFPSQYPASSLTGYGLRPKTSEDLEIEDQIKLVVDSVADETANKLDYFKSKLESQGLDPQNSEYQEALTTHRKLLSKSNIQTAISAYQDRLPPGVDITDPRISSAFNQAVQDFEEAILSGRAVGNADLVGLIGQRFITQDLATQNIPAPAIRVTDESGMPVAGEDGVVGYNSWSRTENQLNNLMVTAKQIDKNNLTRKPTLYAGLAQVFNGLPDDEKAYWYKQSEISAEDKKDAASPLMLWLNASMTQSSSNNDRAMGAMDPRTLVNSLFN